MGVARRYGFLAWHLSVVRALGDSVKETEEHEVVERQLDPKDCQHVQED